MPTLTLQTHFLNLFVLFIFKIGVISSGFSNTYSPIDFCEQSAKPRDIQIHDKLNVINHSDTIVWFDTINDQTKTIVLKNTKIDIFPVVKDTVYVEKLAGNVLNNISSRIKIYKTSYNVAVIQPFLTNLYEEKSDVPVQSLKAIEFYEGLKLALRNLENEGLKLNLYVYDSQKEISALDQIFNELEKREWDLIIGPNAKDALSMVVEYGKKVQVPVLSVFNNNQTIPDSGSFYIQLNPSFETEANSIVQILNNFKKENKYDLDEVNYLLLGLSEDSLKLNEIDQTWKKRFSTDKGLPKVISSENLNIGLIQKYLEKDALNVIVIPSDRSETFIFSCLREISSLYDKIESKNSYRFMVIGTPMWKYFERINFEYYNNLNLHFLDEIYIDKSEAKVVEFENMYKKEYGIAPREFAFVGYDAMIYFGRLLKKYGTAYYENLPKEKWAGLHNLFDFEPILYENTIEGIEESKNYIIGYENKHLNVLKIKNYEIIPVEINSSRN